MSLGLDSDGSASAAPSPSKGQGLWEAPESGGTSDPESFPNRSKPVRELSQGFASTPRRRGRLTPLPLTLPRERLLGGLYASCPKLTRNKAFPTWLLYVDKTARACCD